MLKACWCRGGGGISLCGLASHGSKWLKYVCAFFGIFIIINQANELAELFFNF